MAGERCPKCGSTGTILHTRHRKRDGVTVRTRLCSNRRCRHKYTDAARLRAAVRGESLQYRRRG